MSAIINLLACLGSVALLCLAALGVLCLIGYAVSVREDRQAERRIGELGAEAQMKILREAIRRASASAQSPLSHDVTAADEKEGPR